MSNQYELYNNSLPTVRHLKLLSDSSRPGTTVRGAVIGNLSTPSDQSDSTEFSSTAVKRAFYKRQDSLERNGNYRLSVLSARINTNTGNVKDERSHGSSRFFSGLKWT